MKKKVVYLLLFLLLFLQTGDLIYTFTCRKVGYLSDEVWSYGLANSYYQPFLNVRDGTFVDAIYDEDIINENLWIPGTVLRDYITVQPGERFAYGSVYHNQTLDHHPPFYYMLIHTICSLFPNRFSWWYGFSLSLLFFIGTQIFLFLTARELSHSDAAALVSCLFYGGGTGMLCTFAYIRQYSLLTMLCLAFTYFSVLFYRQQQTSPKIHKGTFAAVVISAFLAFSTHYYAIAYIGIYTALFAFYLLLRRRVKQMFLYGGSLLGALLLFFATYPAALFQFLYSELDAVKLYRTATQIRMLLSLLFEYNFGFATGYFATNFWNVVLPLLGALLVFAVMLLIPFRHEAWFPALMEKIKKTPLKLWQFLCHMNYTPFFILIACFSIYVLIAKQLDVWMQGIFVIRYICFTFPLLCMLAVLALHYVLTLIPRIRKWRIALVFAVVVCVLVRIRLTAPFPYVFARYGDHQNMEEQVTGKRALVVMNNSLNTFVNVACFSMYLYNTEECFFTSADQIHDYWQDILAGDDAVDYILVSASSYDLSPAETQTFRSWFSDDASGEESSDTQDPDTAAQEDAQKEQAQTDPDMLNCTDLIRDLEKTQEYRLKALIANQLDYYYILERTAK